MRQDDTPASLARDGAAPRCLRCASGVLRRSRRRGVDLVFAWLGWFPWRCDACGARRWLRRRR